MIRDRIVVGVTDHSLAEKLQFDKDLTLKKAVDRARRNESVKQQQKFLRGSNHGNETRHAGAAAVDSMKAKPGNKQKKKKSTPKASNSSCKRCGNNTPHKRDDCPAKSVKCYKCSKVGHFGKHCLSEGSASAYEVTEEDPTMPEGFLGRVQGNANEDSKAWTVNIKLGDATSTFKIDTGADVTCIDERTYARSNIGVLRQSDKMLSGPGNNKLTVLGQVDASMTYKNKQTKQKVYVIKDIQGCLLGRPAIQAFKLVSMVNVVTTDVRQQYPNLFQGLGKMHGNYQIKLKPDAKPFALSTPRRIAIPLLPKVKEELAKMEQHEVISKVDEPTEWCSGMVVVPKASGKVRICVDLTKLNESVCREKLQLPAVDHSLGQMGGAKVFSKLDANSGFWQIPLDDESSKLTTFITPFGRYRFNRLPFGISSASEHFQKRVSQILEGLEGVLCHIDDILVFAETQEKHDERIKAVLDKLQHAGVTLNAEKCEFSKKQIKFLGHIISSNGILPDGEKLTPIKNMPTPTDVSGIRRFLGMVNQLGKFSDQLAENTKPLRELLKK